MFLSVISISLSISISRCLYYFNRRAFASCCLDIVKIVRGSQFACVVHPPTHSLFPVIRVTHPLERRVVSNDLIKSAEKYHTEL